MWLIARRSFAEGWGRLLATLLAALFSVALIAGTTQFALRAQEAVSGSEASEYSRTDVLVQGGSVDTSDPNAVPNGTVQLDKVSGQPGVKTVAGDATVPALAAGADGGTITPPAGSRTLLRPWVADKELSPYHLDSGRAPTGDGEIAVMRHIADAGDLSTGDTMKVGLPRETREMKITGVVSVQDSSAVAAGDLLLAAPDTVRDIAGLDAGTWQAVWVKAAGDVSADRLSADLKKGLGAGSVTVREASQVRDVQSSSLAAQGAEIGGGIGMLTAVAVFVGLFVVANTFGGLIRQRTRRLALLSAVGATPEQIKGLIRLEALVLGLLASVGGVVLGYPVSDALTRLFARDGFDISVAEPPSGFIVIGVPIIAGVLVTQLAVWQAARRASNISPMQALRETTVERSERRKLRIIVASVIFVLAFVFWGPIPAVLNDGPPGLERTNAVTALVVYGSMVAVVAIAVLGPLFVRPFGGVVGLLGRAFGGEAGRLARATITRSPQRVSTAASSLMLGVALVTSSLLIIMSANARFDEAGKEVMRAEHAVSTTQKTGDGLRPLPRDIPERIEKAPGVEQATALATADVRLVSPKPKPYAGDDPAKPLFINVTGADQKALPGVLELGGSLKPLAPGEIGVPSALLDAQKLKVGQRIVVRGPNGKVPLTIAGSYHDPSHLFADGALVAPATMEKLDPNAGAHVVLVRGGTAGAVEKAVAGVPGASVLDRSGYVDSASAAITEGTTVIYGFIVMTLILALFGMATTVSMSVTERKKEFGLLGAVGATARQLRTIVRWEAATVVALGTLLGLGAAIGTVALIQVSTGSSYITLNADWWVYAAVVGAAAVVTLATSSFPARRASGIPVLEAAKAE